MGKKLPTIMLVLLMCCSYDVVADDNDKKVDNQQHTELLAINSEELLKLIGDSESNLTLLNFWATWCDPCVEEFPDLVTLSKNYPEDELRVIFVSTDFERSLPAVRQFLVEQNLNFVSYYKNEDDNAFINAISPKWSGVLPATFLYNSTGKELKFWIGSRTLKELETIINAHLNALNTGE